MAQQNGGGVSAVTHEMITPNGEHASSLGGFTAAPGEQPLADRPEVLVGAAFLAGVLLGGLVRRIGR